MEESLYSLKEAAELLGVHPGTLRRWSEKGKIATVRTAGGHRRFSSSEVQRLRQVERAPVSESIGQQLREHALTSTREDISAHQAEWNVDLAEKDREEKRLLGRRLMGLMVQYVGADEGDADHILEEARVISRIYAKGVVMSGIPLQEALKAVNFFRDHILESAIVLPEAARRRPEANQRMFRKLNGFLNEVQLVIADCYEQVGTSSDATDETE